MTIRFTLRFSTHPGQTLHISGDIDQLGENENSRALPMSWLNNDFWQASVELDLDKENPAPLFHYRYIPQGK
jgi:4-alpha-glucanotransferase